MLLRRTCAALLLFAGLASATSSVGAAVPAPRPVDTGRYLLGAVMCPLWHDGSRWGAIARFPEREPLLGWYDEGDPEVTDWEIS